MSVQLLGKEVRFLVPILRDSDREKHEITHWEWLEAQMHVTFPEGWHHPMRMLKEFELRGSVQGYWFDKEKSIAVPDESYEFVVALPPDRMTELHRLFEEICVRFDQKCLYFTSGGDAALYHPTKRQG